MESDNGVTIMEDEKHVIGETTTKENINKQEVEESFGAEIQTKNEVSQSTVEIQGHNSAAVSKNSKHAKVPGVKGVVATKNTKLSTKDKPSLKATTSSSKTQRQNLSKSLTFPTKSTRGDVMKKSTDGILVKTENKHVQTSNGVKVSSRLTNSELNSKEAKTSLGVSKPRTSLASMNKHSKLGKSTPVNAVSKSLTSEAFIPVDHISNPAKAEKPNKEDDDVHSTTSSLTPRRRNSGSGFSFRLEERAEKRKEFFSKLEEKTQEKEAEITNQQEKSKESQEKEIKKLRKKMTFKAAPMPSFYKEPPPKVELKKIPTTRPKSPKLGRNKESAMNNISEDKSSSNPHGRQRKIDSTKAKVKGYKEVSSKKPIRKTQTKLQSQEMPITKTESDSAKSTKNKVSEISEDAKEGIEGNEECKDQLVDISEYQNGIELESQNDLAQNSELVSITSTPEIVSYEVTVGV